MSLRFIRVASCYTAAVTTDRTSSGRWKSHAKRLQDRRTGAVQAIDASLLSRAGW